MHKIIWFASQNEQKINEMKTIMAEAGFQVQSLLDFNPELVINEDGDSYAANALIKARTLAKLVNAPVIGDDTGLEIMALNNFPGLYSNRWKADLTFYQAMQTILAKMENTNNRKAAMITTIAYVDPINQIEKTFEGKITGEIVTELFQDQGGFGYDQFFYVPSQKQTFYEMGPNLKNQISHRALAIKQLLDFLKKLKTT